jgi:hypothetical protein
MWVGGGLLIVVAALAISVAVLARRAEPYLRAQIVAYLQQKFHARVELDAFHISLRHGLHGQWGVLAQGSGLRIWPSADAEARRQLEGADSGGPDAPLIRLQTFQFHAPLRFEHGKPIVISVVQIQGLDIDVPPRRHAGSKPEASGGSTPIGAAPGPSANTSQQGVNNNAGDKSKPGGVLSDVVVDRIECDQATLLLETDKPGKVPLGFAISHLTLTNVTADGPMKFDANLTNPRPQGNIHTIGSFGPWQSSDPGESAVSGDYQFDHADLGDFKGIAGILNSTGQYQGTLRNIVVDGVTDTPDFQLTSAGNPMPLHTNFHAIVDGTDGDTWLQPVDAMLGKSHFTAQGQIVRLKIPPPSPDKSSTPQVKAVSLQSPSPTQAELRPQGGLDIQLAINVDRARIEDFLRLAMRGSAAPVLTGAVKVKATLHIPSGKTPVPQRMTLKGKFFLDQAQFSSPKIQGGIEQLSLRGQGRPKDLKMTDPSSVDSTMESDFQMANGVITLPGLAYAVPGATINVAGTYGVTDGALNFKGNIKMDATVSQIVGGWKGFLLKPADRFFKKDGAGTELPIHIDGTREHPGFGVDFGRMKGTSAEIPGQQPADPPKTPASPDDKQPGTQ